jgi:mRNA interferase HigB
MKVSGKEILLKMIRKYPDTKGSISSFVNELNTAEWRTPHDIQSRYPSADNLGRKCYVFNIKGNNYRVVIKFNFIIPIARIRWAGSHADYDKLNIKEDVC